MHLAHRSKPGRKNESYLEFVREHPTCTAWEIASYLAVMEERQAGGYPETVSHHVRMGGGGGMGLKPSDYRSVPLMDREHRELHQKGEPSFWAARGVNPDKIIITLLTAWLGERHSAAVTDMVGDERKCVRDIANDLVAYAEKVG